MRDGDPNRRAFIARYYRAIGRDVRQIHIQTEVVFVRRALASKPRYFVAGGNADGLLFSHAPEARSTKRSPPVRGG